VPKLLAIAIVLGPLAAAPLAAGELYRCVGKQGEIAYTSSRAGYTQCSSLHYAEPAPAAKPAAPPASVAGQAGPRVEFRSAPGAAAPVEPAGSARAKVNSGAVYRYKKDGVTHYTNRRPVGQRVDVLFTYIESCFACTLRGGVDFGNVALNTSAFVAEIASAAADAGIDAAFVRAVIHAESAFNPNALSNKGAQGLMQLMPATAKRFGVTDAFSAADNIRGGTRYLAWLLKRFNGDTRLAAAGYNAGEGAVDRHAGVPPYEETQRFVERVGVLHGRYQTALAGATGAGAAGSP
jgi:hypothetical protein